MFVHICHSDHGGCHTPFPQDQTPPLRPDPPGPDPLEGTWDQTGSDIIFPYMTSSVGHQSGWYASYWNAFLLQLLLSHCSSERYI